MRVAFLLRLALLEAALALLPTLSTLLCLDPRPPRFLDILLSSLPSSMLWLRVDLVVRPSDVFDLGGEEALLRLVADREAVFGGILSEWRV